MIKRWDEKLADLSTNLASLSKKAADASEDAKAARELRQEMINDRISTAKGNVAALQERIRISGEEKKGKLDSAVLKAQMTVREKIRQHRENRDKRQFEKYIDDQISFIYESFDTASYLISDAQLAILETIKAIDEYNEKYGDASEETSEDVAEDMSEDAAEDTAEDADADDASEDTAGNADADDASEDTAENADA